MGEDHQGMRGNILFHNQSSALLAFPPGFLTLCLIVGFPQQVSSNQAALITSLMGLLFLFVDNSEKSHGVSSSQALMNLHNNEAWKKVKAGTKAGKQAHFLELPLGWAELCPVPYAE